MSIETIELAPDDAGIVLAENKPFFIPAQDPTNRFGLLLVHGFTGSPWEMRELGLDLAQTGACSLGVRLPGHGTTATDLAVRRYEEWLLAVEDGHRALRERCETVIGIGLSTGALLLLAAAERLPFAGLVLYSPYLKMHHWLAPLAGVLRFVMPYYRRPAGFDESPYYYRERPLAGAHQINRLIRRVRGTLRQHRMPALIASAAGDRTVRAESAVTIFSRIGSSRKEYIGFGERVPHVLTTTDNPEQGELFRLTRAFLAAIMTGNRG